MADQIQEALEVPRDFLREGVQFVNKCQKRACRTYLCNYLLRMLTIFSPIATTKEYASLCQAVGVGFLVMGFVGYVVKLSTNYPLPILSAIANPVCSPYSGQ